MTCSSRDVHEIVQALNALGDWQLPAWREKAFDSIDRWYASGVQAAREEALQEGRRHLAREIVETIIAAGSSDPTEAVSLLVQRALLRPQESPK
jgi:hypothetical protein